MIQRTLWLVRHPPIDAAYRNLCYGISDIPLSPDWESHLEPIMQQLDRSRITHLFHSGLQRTSLPATALAQQLGLTPMEDHRLRERSFGDWEKQAWDEIYHQTGDAMMGMITDPESWSPPNGETTFALRDRVLKWLNDLPGSGSILAITHGGPIAALLGTLNQIPVQQWPKLVPGHAELIRIDEVTALK